MGYKGNYKWFFRNSSLFFLYNCIDLNSKKTADEFLVKKKDPLILTNEAEPLILTNEIKKEKSPKVKEINENLSPAVRKIVVENNIDIEPFCFNSSSSS